VWTTQVRGTATGLLAASRRVASRWDIALLKAEKSSSCREQLRVGSLKLASRRWQLVIEWHVRRKLLALLNRRRSKGTISQVKSSVITIRRLIAAYSAEGQKVVRAVRRCSQR
jgi:hypothetical protein